jgi:predicted dehydrogenase
VVTTICDADQAVAGPALKVAEQVQGKAPAYVQDLRKVIDDKAIDVISIATPNHWHALAAIWALQAGKDVYVEKPVSHNVREGRCIVEAARKYRRVCQAGTQCRSSTGLRQAIEFLRAGRLGHVKLARGLCYKLRPSIGSAGGEQLVPASVDYDLWCGPAPKKPLTRKRLHYDWHWFWDYGNGDLGNQGIHQMDIARWALGKNELPRAAQSIGGRFGYTDDGETPNTQICTYDYGDCELIFEVRGLPTKPLYGASIGDIIYGTDGYLVIPSYTTATAFTPEGHVIQKFSGSGDHYQNFIQAVRRRRPEDLHADVLDGHLSSALCHLGNISYRLGSVQPCSKASNSLGDDKEAYESLARMEEYLKGDHVPVDRTAYRVGPRLSIDPRAESFIGAAEADAYLSREYRKGFEVPERV